MLKFKEIRRSIINNKDKKGCAPLENSKVLKTRSPLAFKKSGLHQPISPSRNDQMRTPEHAKYETCKKRTVSPLTAFDYNSDCKENSSRNAHPQGITFSHLSERPKEYVFQTRRKATVPDNKPSLYAEPAQFNAPAKNNLSFASLLQSKKTSTKHSYLGSDRKDDRESSISKLKDKLFAMKRLISDKEKKAPEEKKGKGPGQAVPAPKQTPTTPTPRQVQTARDMSHSPLKLSKPSYTQQDIVRISLKSESMDSELDMSPYLY